MAVVAEAAPAERVAVIVPARNEAGTLGACLEALAVAADAVAGRVACTAHIVVSDSEDATADVAVAFVSAHPGWGLTTLSRRVPVGMARSIGCEAALASFRTVDPARCWLMQTDADSVVPPDWVALHLHRARAWAAPAVSAVPAVAAVAGLVELAGGDDLHPVALAQYEHVVAAKLDGDRHRHVYGANLSVRADAYMSVGGFAPCPTGEDVDLVGRLRGAGFRVEYPTDIVVATSARTVGRAPGGLADLLAVLDGDARRAG